MKQNFQPNRRGFTMPETEIEFWIQFWKEAYLRSDTFDEREHMLYMLTTYVKDYYK